MEKHKYWTFHEKATQLITALNEPDAYILHGILTAATYAVLVSLLRIAIVTTIW
jgi:hypothetical protein